MTRKPGGDAPPPGSGKSSRTKMDERLEFEKLASGISARLIDLPATEVDSVIDQGLRLLAEFFHADRALIAEYIPDQKGWHRIHVWFSETFDASKAIVKDDEILSNSYPYLTEVLMNEGAMLFDHPEQIPEEWEEERASITRLGLQAGASVRLGVGGDFLGAISIDRLHEDSAWPEDMILRLKFMGDIFANALHRKRDQQALDERMQFETLASRITSELMNISLTEMDKVMEEALELLGGFFDADRAVISQFLEEENSFWPSHVWLGTEENDRDGEGSAFGTPHPLPNLKKHVLAKGFYTFNRSEGVPIDWKEEQLFLKKAKALSAVGVPLRNRGEFLGVLNIADLRTERSWPDDLIRRLQFLGEIFAKALNCGKSEESLHKAFSEIKVLKAGLKTEAGNLKEEGKPAPAPAGILGRSEAIQDVLKQVEQVAGTESIVLVLGETGTGKELIAQAIHDLSQCSGQALIKVNCAAMPSTLIESELFGREKGAFTGALTKQIGRFEMADGGTIFLDEIGELSTEVQVKLLRVLQEGEFERLGSSQTLKINARVITATNKDLAQAVRDGDFREDLYYRLNVFPISLPPLRKRKEDIPGFVWAFIKEFDRKMGKRIETVTRHDMEAMQRYSWPGNIRELRNVIERAMILSTGSTLQLEMPQTAVSAKPQGTTLQEVEKNHITSVLERCGWRVRGENGAAEILGLKPTTLEARMRKLEIQREK